MGRGGSLLLEVGPGILLFGVKRDPAGGMCRFHVDSWPRTFHTEGASNCLRFRLKGGSDIVLDFEWRCFECAKHLFGFSVLLGGE